ncbi:MAG: hypothetical protein K2N87_12220 [Eubacterium sp.]|nr:hypothetical protein [Eubacterium sp.]
MPQILEEAMIGCYEKKGWQLDTNENKKDNVEFPMMSDLLEEMKLVVKEKGFSDRMRADYEGSLVSRLSNLTKGTKGRILNCPSSIDFDFLVHNNVIIEMEALKSPEDKALFMGFILSRLSEVIKLEHKKDSGFRHLTLIEEAHRLLAKADYGDSGSKKAAVETFTDLLAEIRKYGEGLIVVDQIPNKLAPEVLKNTNTKIIHKILARDDKEAVGDTMLMNEKQKESLSALEPGHAIIFSEDTDKPVHVYVERETDTNEEEMKEQEIKKLFDKNHKIFGDIYDELEIRPYFDEYVQIAKMIRCREIDEKSFEKFKKNLQKISDHSGSSVKEVLKKLYKRRERLRGNAENDQLAEEMSDFLNKIFQMEYEDLNYKVLDREKCKNIQ